MQLRRVVSLRDVIVGAEELGWSLRLARRHGGRWEPDAAVIVYDDSYELPDDIAERGFEDADLYLQDIQGILANAREQRPNASVEQLCAAIAYYEEYDAYVEWPTEPGTEDDCANLPPRTGHRRRPAAALSRARENWENQSNRLAAAPFEQANRLVVEFNKIGREARCTKAAGRQSGEMSALFDAVKTQPQEVLVAVYLRDANCWSVLTTERIVARDAQVQSITPLREIRHVARSSFDSIALSTRAGLVVVPVEPGPGGEAFLAAACAAVNQPARG